MLKSLFAEHKSRITHETISNNYTKNQQYFLKHTAVGLLHDKIK